MLTRGATDAEVIEVLRISPATLAAFKTRTLRRKLSWRPSAGAPWKTHPSLFVVQNRVDVLLQIRPERLLQLVPRR
jgi:hypothetical protein